jgi:hypothetical protein
MSTPLCVNKQLKFCQIGLDMLVLKQENIIRRRECNVKGGSYEFDLIMENVAA